MKLPTQLWLSEEDAVPAPTRLKDAVNASSTFWKPTGGIWTSTYGGGCSEWWEWCKGEGFGDYRSAWLLEPMEARILVIRNPEDLAAAHLLYPRKSPDELGNIRSYRDLLDYEKIKYDYDAMWVPNPHPHRLTIDSLFFNVMDVESTVWFRWCFSNIEKIDLESPHRMCRSEYKRGKEKLICRLTEGHDEMHKAGWFESFSWSDKAAKLTKEEA